MRVVARKEGVEPVSYLAQPMLENTASDQIFVWMRPMPVPVQAPPPGHDAARGGEALPTAPGKPGGGIRSFGVPEPHAATVLSRVARGNTIFKHSKQDVVASTAVTV